MSTRTRTGQSLVLFKFANTSMKLFYCLSIKPYGIVSFDMASYFDVIYKLLLLKFLDRKLCSEFYIGYSVRYKRNQVFFIQFVFISLQWFETMCTFNDAHLLHVHLLVCIFAHIPFVSIKRPFVSWFNIKYLMSVNCLLLRICDAEILIQILLEFNNFQVLCCVIHKTSIEMCIIIMLIEEL